MQRLKLLIVMILYTFSCAKLHALQADRSAIRDNLLTSLSSASTTADSIRELYNIFDLSTTSDERTRSAALLLEMAERSGNEVVAMDMYRHMADANQRNDSLMNSLIHRVERYPNTDLKKETLVYIKVCKATLASKFLSEDDRQKKILELIKEYGKNDTTDPYEKMVQLYTICSYLGSETHGELLTEYFNDLQRRIAALPLTTFSIRNKLYSQQAITYTNNGDHKKAIEADRMLLKIMDEMEQNYKERGRAYRNLDLNRYISLRRILKNYEGLTDKEAEDYYARIKEVASRLASAQADMDYYKQPQLYMMMKRGEYADAIPLIKLSLSKASDIFSRRYYLQMLMEASEAVGDQESQLMASMEYAKALEDYVKLKSAERYRELQIIYEVNRLKDRNTMNELDRQRESNKMQSTIINISIVTLVVLLVIAAVFIILFRRFRKLSMRLEKSNAELEHESEVLKATRDKLIAARDKAREAEKNKTDFINYISHEIITPLNTITEYSQMIIDSADESKRDYLLHFSQVVQLNTVMLQSFVLDLQDFSQFESKRMSVKIRPTDIKKICQLSIDNVKVNLHPGVKLIFLKAKSEPILIDTDSYRLQVVLLNLLINAAKFTTEGTITLDYEVNDDNVRFIVTDTGCGIPDEKAHLIFNRYEKLNVESEGPGLGLPVCKLIAELLHGSIEYDSTYKNGARFIFTIPRNDTTEQ